MQALSSTIMLLLLFLAFPSLEIGRTLQECIEVAKAFHNTCSVDPTNGPTAAASVSALAAQTVTCTNVGRCNTGDSGFSGSASSCTSSYKLCVSCRDDSGTVKIRVQSNNIPRSCYSTPQNIASVNYDYEVEFNSAGDQNNPLQSPNTQTAVNNLLCDIEWPRTLPSGINLN